MGYEELRELVIKKLKEDGNYLEEQIDILDSNLALLQACELELSEKQKKELIILNWLIKIKDDLVVANSVNVEDMRFYKRGKKVAEKAPEYLYEQIEMKEKEIEKLREEANHWTMNNKKNTNSAQSEPLIKDEMKIDVEKAIEVWEKALDNKMTDEEKIMFEWGYTYAMNDVNEVQEGK